MSAEPSKPGPSTPEGEAGVEWLPSSHGPVLPGLGLVIAGVLAVVAVVDRSRGSLTLLGAAGLVAGLTWVALLRPRVGLQPAPAVGRPARYLVVRGLVTTVAVPLAAVTDVEVRQMLVVRAGEQRFASPTVGRSRKSLVRSGPGGRSAFGGGAGGGAGAGASAPEAAPSIDAVGVTLARIEGARTDARRRHPDDASTPTQRTWQPLLLLALALALGVLVVGVSVG